MNKNILILTGLVVVIGIALFSTALKKKPTEIIPPVTDNTVYQAENVVVTSVPLTSAITEETVPLPQPEDVIRSFLTAIDEGRPSDAVMMMTPINVENDATKQAWGVQFNAFENLTLIKISPAGENTYRVDVDVTMKPEAENAQPMPNYGWNNGENTRWISVEKIDSGYRISGIATGP